MEEKIHIPIPKKTFELRPISELVAIVKRDFHKFDDEGLIDEGSIIKTVMACNDRLGIMLREINQKCVSVDEFKAKLPLNFEKLFYIACLNATNTMTTTGVNPFDNSFDRDVIYEAELDRGSFGNSDSYSVTIKRETQTTTHFINNMISLDVGSSCLPMCHISCPNIDRKGRYTVTIEGDYIVTPFRKGELYIMYLGTMEDENGNLLFPFHPLITPYYEWSIKEKIVMDAIFNSDSTNGDLLKLAQSERVKSWLDAFSFTTEKGYGEYVDAQKKKEMGWYNKYFKFFK